MALPPLSVSDTIAVLRSRYPAVLVCTVCAVLLATQAASYAKSGLTEEQRLGFVCAGCRLDADEAERVHAQRVAQAAVAREAAAALRRERDGQSTTSTQDDASGTRVNTGDSGGVSITRRPQDQAHHGVKGGRPRKHASDLVARREAQRAYRQRQKAAA